MPRSPAPQRRAKATTVDYDTVREIGLALPGVEEGTSYGTPALRVKGKFMLRLKEDPDILVVRTDFFEREHRMKSDPATFFITDHYRDYPAMLVRLSTVRLDDLRDLIEQAWRRSAPKSLLARHRPPS